MTYPFEKSMEKLSGIVDRMETGELSLAESLAAFEEGIKLTRECQKALEEAEQKVNLLLESKGELTETPFQPTDD